MPYLDSPFSITIGRFWQSSMARARQHTPILAVCLGLTLCHLACQAAESPSIDVVLRSPAGPFLTASGGPLRPGPWLPGPAEIFRMRAQPLHAGTHRQGESVTLSAPCPTPGPIPLVFTDGNKVQVLQPGVPAIAADLYAWSELPAGLVSTLNTVVRVLAQEELADRQYDKTKTRKREQTLELPAPTLRDLRRKKTHHIRGLEEEYQIQARLKGEPKIEVLRIPYLRPYGKPGEGWLLFEVRASVPVQGRVRYKIPDVLSASTGYDTMVELRLIGQVRLQKADGKLSVAPAEALQVDLRLTGLKLSNDLLNALRKLIEEAINHELRDNEPRVLQQANKAIQKGMQAREFQHPLLKFLVFP